MTLCLLCKTLGLSKLVVSIDEKEKRLNSRLENDNFQTLLLKETMAKCHGFEKSGKYIHQERQPKKIFIGAKYLSFFSSCSLKMREKYISFAQFVYFLRELPLNF